MPLAKIKCWDRNYFTLTYKGLAEGPAVQPRTSSSPTWFLSLTKPLIEFSLHCYLSLPPSLSSCHSLHVSQGQLDWIILLPLLQLMLTLLSGVALWVVICKVKLKVSISSKDGTQVLQSKIHEKRASLVQRARENKKRDTKSKKNCVWLIIFYAVTLLLGSKSYTVGKPFY